jgi:hypothetical protein
MVATFGWAILYSRHAEPKIAASLQQMAQEQDTRYCTSRAKMIYYD